jgi:hypothetical protein
MTSVLCWCRSMVISACSPFRADTYMQKPRTMPGLESSQLTLNRLFADEGCAEGGFLRSKRPADLGLLAPKAAITSAAASA